MAADSADDLLQQFCAELRQLWLESGQPGLRALAPRVGLSKTQLGTILTGQVRRPPDWRVVHSLVTNLVEHSQAHDRLGHLSVPTGVEEYWRLWHALVEHAVTRSRPNGREPAVTPVVPPQTLTRTESRLYDVCGAGGPSSCRIGLVTGTIRQIRHIDVWVNSENTDLEMSRVTDFSVSGIIRYWGAARDPAGRVTDDLVAKDLARVVGNNRPVAPGTAWVTTSGALAGSHDVRYVIHVAAVQGTPGVGFRQVANVADCVTNTLVAADELAATDEAVRSIVFPILGAGVAGAGIEPTVRIMVDAAVAYLDATAHAALRAIYLLAHTQVELAALERAVAATPGLVATPA